MDQGLNASGAVSRRVRTPEETLEYLRTNVYIDGECRVWAGAFGGKNGTYPQIRYHGKTWQARRLLMHLTGRLEPGAEAADTCDNHACINEKHLVVGSRQRVCKLAADKGRLLTGTNRSLRNALGAAKHKSYPMPVTDLPKVMQMIASGMTVRQIAEHYGIRRGVAKNKLDRWVRAGLMNYAAFRRGEDNHDDHS